MELYLMQHGRAVPEEENPEQPLSREGVAQIQATAAAMKRMGIAFDVIVCSPKKRSRQSAALVAEGVNYPYSDIVETETVKATAPPDEAVSFLRGFGREKRVLVAGHLPSLARIASLLLGGDTSVRVRFENGGLCRIDAAELKPGEGELVFLIPAEQMKMLAGK
ncbi:histidine phosphatase family protein [Desulfuromonas sp. TF]|uniref:SixA phosphatase family protein n=1 Tax=Desulfuromonas sp. TF TaxID=1232410 RepID=UPI00041920C6|nr:histidine phosphatase family protein [Desulfuromonas sp. TF]